MIPRYRRLLPALLAVAAAPVAAAAPRLAVLEGVPAATAVLLARGGEGGPLPIAAGAFPLDFAGAPARALVVIEIDGRSLVAAAAGSRAGLEIHLYVVSADGSISRKRSEAVSIDLATDGARLGAGGVRWLAAIELPVGSHGVRVNVREHFSGAFGQREIRLGAGGPAGVAAAAADLPWLEVMSPSLGAEDRAVLDTVGGAPAAVPVLAAGATARLARWRAAGADEPLPLRLCDAAGRTLAGLTPRVEGSSSFAPRLAVDRYTVELPGDLSGRLGLAWGDGEPARAIVTSGEATAWNRMPALDLPASRAGRAASPAGGARGRIEQERTAREVVLRAWRRFAGGDRDGAVAELLEVEVGPGARRSAAGAAGPEQPLAERLVEHGPSLLLPVSLLYLDLERAELAAGRLPAARRAREVAEVLAGRFAAASASPEERRRAASLLEVLAADHLAGRDSAGAAALLERAARLAPDRIGPWLTIGILYERDRVLDRAIAAFDRVLAADPGHREARLRRARVGLLAGRAEAGAELERLAAEELDWIGVVAAEERVRQQLAAGDIEAAIALLAPLVAARPEEPSLARALAYALERSGRRAAAREHAARAASAASHPGSSPRKRYAEAPERLLLDRRVEVERGALLALPQLAAALADDGARP